MNPKYANCASDLKSTSKMLIVACPANGMIEVFNIATS